MEITHRTNNLRIAPRKLRLVADQIRYQNAKKALGILPLVPQRGGQILEKSLKSAIQVASDNNMDTEELIIQQIWCDEGSKLKRTIGHSRGRFATIMKHYSHVSIVLKGEVKRPARRKAPSTEATPEK